MEWEKLSEDVITFLSRICDENKALKKKVAELEAMNGTLKEEKQQKCHRYLTDYKALMHYIKNLKSVCATNEQFLEMSKLADAPASSECVKRLAHLRRIAETGDAEPLGYTCAKEYHRFRGNRYRIDYKVLREVFFYLTVVSTETQYKVKC